MVTGERPSLSHDEIRGILRNSYGIEEVASIKPVVSYYDQNFLITVSLGPMFRFSRDRRFHAPVVISKFSFKTKLGGHQLLLKIMNWKSSENRGLHGILTLMSHGFQIIVSREF